jgi:hypothetical protein
MPKGQNSKPKTGFVGSRKTGFSGLEKLWVTRFFGFGQNRVGNPILRVSICIDTDKDRNATTSVIDRFQIYHA